MIQLVFNDERLPIKLSGAVILTVFVGYDLFTVEAEFFSDSDDFCSGDFVRYEGVKSILYF